MPVRQMTRAPWKKRKDVLVPLLLPMRYLRQVLEYLVVSLQTNRYQMAQVRFVYTSSMGPRRLSGYDRV
jgi:hypothetical protein